MNKKTKIMSVTLAIFTLLTLTNCQNDEVVPLPIKGILTTGDTASNFKVEVLDSGTSEQKVGKSTIVLKLSNRTDGLATNGKTLTLVPNMAMVSGHNHGTPVDSIVDNGDGTYTITLYYLMATNDMMGNKAGDWTAKMQIVGDKVVTSSKLDITVGGSMMDRVVLKGVNDKITNMSVVEKRKYFIFKEMVMGTSGAKSVKLFLATRESMVNHPAVFATKSLNGESSSSWTVSTVTLKVYQANSTWITLTDNGNGHFSASNVNITDMQKILDFQLNIDNGTVVEQKTTNGLVYDSNVDPTAKTNDEYDSNGFGHLMLMSM